MKTQTLEHVKELQRHPSQIRNICILAHVDHGKTTIADALVASNGIISKRNAGKIRYMDSRTDEQERGITMKSSAITLLYEKQREQIGNETALKQYLINLIDSPGHVDFSSEVTTAVRLCDGAVVVVDVVEGVCPQTQAVLRQAWLEKLRPILVLNKLDRLISQLKMTPIEAHYRLILILEQVNLITNQLFTSDAMEKTSLDTNEGLDNKQTKESNSYDWTVIEDEEEQKNIYFSPELGNVIFASAIDGWGFTMCDFARMYAAKLGVREQILHKTLWGDYYMNMKAKRIMKGAQSKGKKPLFVQFALDNIWAVYDAVLEQRDSAMTEKIVKSLDLTLAPKDLRHKDSRVLLQSIMGQWLPLSDAVLDTVTSHIPSPLEMSEEKVQGLLCSNSRQFSSLPEATQHLKTDFQACSSSADVPVIIFISKMFPVEKICLPQNKSRPLTEEETQQKRVEARRRYAELLAKQDSTEDGGDGSKEVKADSKQSNGHTYLEVSATSSDKEDTDDHAFVAFARIFSGTVRKGSQLFFLGPKHDPAEALRELSSLNAEDLHAKPEFLASHPHITSVTINDLYLMMGREMEAMEEIPAGNVFGIGGLSGVVVKSGTLASTLACPAFTDMYFDAAPIVRVAVEPVNASDMNKLVAGLRLLNQADPCVEIRVQETGEHVIIAAGEVHLQKCIDDLKERYAKIEVNVSKPIVPFRETVVVPPKLDMVNENIQEQGEEVQEDSGIIQASTADRQCHLLLRAAPLPGKIADILLQNQQSLKALDMLTTAAVSENSDLQVGYRINESASDTLKSIRQQLKEEFDNAGPEWSGAEEKIWSFGPRRCGPNILLNYVKGYSRPVVWQSFEKNGSDTCRIADLDNSIVTGFQMATLAGPLCEEPMHGVCFIVEDWWFGDRVKPLTQNVEVAVSNTDSSIVGEDSGSKDIHGSLSEDFKTHASLSNSTITDTSSNVVHNRSKPSIYVPGYESFQPQKSAYGPLSGQLISTMKEGCRQAFQVQPQRLVAAMYRCEIQATVEVLGKLHGVLSKRCGQVLSEEMQEGTAAFVIIAVLPVVESFGFAEDIRKKTSGLASPQLKFSHWEVLPVDPFWVPTTEEEYMHFGEKADADNRARVYMNQVRKRKGLPTDEKIVEFGEKQRTLTKNK